MTGHLSAQAATPRSPRRKEVAELVVLARKLVDAHSRRNPTSASATLGEEDAIFNLRWQLNELAKRCSGGRLTGRDLRL